MISLSDPNTILMIAFGTAIIIPLKGWLLYRYIKKRIQQEQQSRD